MKRNITQANEEFSPEKLLEQFASLNAEQRERVEAFIQQQIDISSSKEDREAEITQILEGVDFLSCLTEAEKRALAGHAVELNYEPGAFMIYQGAKDNWLYVVAEGEAEVQITVEGTNITKPVAEVRAGEYIGEMALLTGEPRRASVVAKTRARCYRLGSDEFHHIVHNRPEIINSISDFLARRFVEIRAARERKFSLFYLLPEQERSDLLTRLETTCFPPNTIIAKQNSEEDWMYIIIDGEAEVRLEDDDGASKKIAVLRAGDIFGEMALLSGEPRKATVTAITRVDCYIFRRPMLNELIERHPNFLAALQEILTRRERELDAVRDELSADQEQRRLRTTQNGLARRIRRFFSVGLPPASVSPLLSETPTHSATGKLFFEYRTPSGKDKPLHNMYVELWHKDAIEIFLGVTTTARDGSFEIWYNPAIVGGKANLELRVFESHHTYSKQGELQLENKHVFSIAGDTGVTDLEYSFGEHRLPYWEYDPNTPIPRALIVEQGTPPQSYAPGRSITLVKVVAPMELVKRKHLLEHRLNQNLPDLKQIQKDYPENLTLRLERERPGYTRSDEFFGERILNGLSATVLDEDETHPGWFRLYHHWNSYEMDGEHALPNVDMRFEIRNERLYPIQITLYLRAPGAADPNSPTEKITVTPQDGERWLQAKRVARVSAALSAELDNHLVATHLNVEQYALASYRNLRKNPLRYLLFPHIKEVVLVDHAADSFLLGPDGYITRATALTDLALKKRIHQTLGTLDWKNWESIQPVCDTHTYAKVANLYWEVLKEYVEDFFNQHEEEIVAHWYEVHMLSQDLVQHSVPYFLCQYLQNSVAGRPEGEGGWFNPTERMALSIPRHAVNGIPRAVQPITLSNIPSEMDIENMKQVCAYVIYHATFKHTWANMHQYDDGGEIIYCSLGLRYGENGVFGPESDYSIAPPPDRATELLWISYFLSNAVYGYIMKNEDNDINPVLIEMLERRREEFAALGFEIDKIQSRVNI